MSITYSRAQYTNYRLNITGVGICRIATGSWPMDQYGGLLLRGAHCALTALWLADTILIYNSANQNIQDFI